VTGDTNAVQDVFVRDTVAATTTRVSVTTAGARGNGTSDEPSLTDDGRYVVFASAATNLVAGDTNAKGISSSTTSPPA
jgi:Tol biopolymer transport system component